VPTDALAPDVPLAPRILLARFHPLADDSQIVVIGRVVCAADGAHLDAASPGGLFQAPPTVLLKLRYLIERAAPNPFESLRKLRSRFWSFVEITPSEKEPDA
jgi:hypothetical protein